MVQSTLTADGGFGSYWSRREGGDFKTFRDDRLVGPAFAT